MRSGQLHPMIMALLPSCLAIISLKLMRGYIEHLENQRCLKRRTVKVSPSESMT